MSITRNQAQLQDGAFQAPSSAKIDSTIAAPGYNPLDGIDWGTALPDNNITVFFAPNGYYESGEGITSNGFTAFEIQQFQTSFDMIEAVANVTFTTVTSAAAADLVIVLDTNEGWWYGDALGYFNPPGEWNAGVGIFNGALWDRNPGGDLEIGGYGFVTITHELLHGMGLAHPHDDGGWSSVYPGVTSAFDDTGDALLNQGVFTTMSYNSGFFEGPVGTSAIDNNWWNWGYEAGPMALDIAVLQDKYGANTTHASGNDTYTLPGSNASGTSWQAIWDTGGADRIVFSGSRDATIDLRAATLEYAEGGGGFISAVAGIAGGFTIANGVVIENALTGSGNDTVRGNDVANSITTNAGNDTVFAGLGKDTVRAGLGDDTISGENGNDRLYGGGGNDRLNGGANNDMLDGGSGNDRLFGGTGGDKLYGNSGNDSLTGGGGRDRLDGGTGNDKLTGNAGVDVFVFRPNYDIDTVKDFEVGTDKIRLLSTWNGEALTEATVIAMAEVTATGLEFDFGNGDVLVLQGVFTTTGLEGSFLF